MTNTVFTGSAVALATPFRQGEVDFQALARLVDFQSKHGSDALVVCGTTGEASVLSADEQERILSFVLERVNGRIPVIAGSGGNCTANVIGRSKRAQTLGAQGLLVVTPYYNKTSQRGLIAHYTAVADAVNIPIILYNVPSRTGLNMLPETIATLAEHPNIAGIKEAGGNISQIAETARLIDRRMAIYSGNDDQILPMLSLGAVGVISAAGNIIPDLMHQMVEAWHMGAREHARELQLSVLPLCHALFSDVNPIPVKAALEMMGLCRSEVRLPLIPLNREKQEALAQVMRKMKLISA